MRDGYKDEREKGEVEKCGSEKVRSRRGQKREAIERLFKAIGSEVMIEEVNKVGGVQGKKIWQVRLGNEEQKKEVMTKKKLLRGRREMIENLTWKERKMR